VFRQWFPNTKAHTFSPDAPASSAADTDLELGTPATSAHALPPNASDPMIAAAPRSEVVAASTISPHARAPPSEPVPATPKEAIQEAVAHLGAGPPPTPFTSIHAMPPRPL
jgi:hypothetical protein